MVSTEPVSSVDSFGRKHLLEKVSWNVVINQGERKHFTVIFRINKGKTCFLQYKMISWIIPWIFKEPKGKTSPTLFFSGTTEVPHILEMKVSNETSMWALISSVTSAEFCHKEEEQGNSLLYLPMSSFHITSYTYLMNKNSKIIILTIKKAPPHKQNKNNTNQKKNFFLYF